MEFKKAIESITGLKLDNLNEKEQKDASERLLKYREGAIKNFEEIQKELKQVSEVKDEAIITIDNLKKYQNDLEIKISNQTEMLKAKDEIIAKLKEQTGGISELSITQLFKEIINKILKS